MLVSIRRTLGPNGEPRGRGCWLWCPGCQKAHRPQIKGEAGDLPVGPCWEWNGQDGELFGIEPSLLVNGGEHSPTPEQIAAGFHRCHSFIRNGEWEFLSDSTHALAGQRVKLVPLPDWLAREH